MLVVTCVSFDVESDGVCGDGSDSIFVLVEVFGDSFFMVVKLVRFVMTHIMKVIEVT